ncbi:ParB N-terminal domain-containing protein [Kutzneria chonburiensis]|uniref:ParB N-terminal domain-containing protein n=1 Tax=Kutzneria chonburiensis TaxID=1483604 RepID=A0ABV6MK64_9PSEU|nr:ParB N-terminal domain-containing protein [Kutzneria chonburiensis]
MQSSTGEYGSDTEPDLGSAFETIATLSRTTTEIPIADVAVGEFSVRANGVDRGHLQLLIDSAARLPPVIVHRQTMAVIDGVHRLRVAALRGDSTIRVRFFDGDAEAAFALAVRLNIAHGLPLSVSDRKRAARRILTAHPDWSYRYVAGMAGLSDKTVAALSRSMAAEIPQSNIRLARNGVRRRVDSTQARLRTAELFRQDDAMSLREAASRTGVSVSTASDVRNRIRRGDDPLPVRLRSAAAEAAPRRANEAGGVGNTAPMNREMLRRRLKNDPSLRFTDAGRTLLRWLEGPTTASEWESVLDSVPGYCRELISEIATMYAEDLRSYANTLKRGASTAS